MIRSLRSRHRTMMVALALIVAPLFIAGLLSREAMPVQSLESVSSHAGAELISTHRAKNDRVRLDTRIVEIESELYVEADFEANPPAPDTLLYWSPTGSNWRDQGRLLGAVREGDPLPLPLPREARSSEGMLILISLARNEELLTVALPALEPGIDR